MNRKPFAKLPHNARVEEFLAANGLPGVVAKWLPDGSMKHHFMLAGYEVRPSGQRNNSRPLRWSEELAAKLTALGFRYFMGQPFPQFAGNGGWFSVYVTAPAGLDPRNVAEVA